MAPTSAGRDFSGHEIERNEIHGSYLLSADCGLEGDGQSLGIGVDSQVAKLNDGGDLQLVVPDYRTCGGFCKHGPSRGESTGARHNVGDVAAIHGASEALIEMGVAGEQDVGPLAGCLAAGVDVFHQAPAAAGFGVHRKRGMVNRDDDGAGAGRAFCFKTPQLRGQEIQLVVHQRKVSALRGDDASTCIHYVAVEADDGDVGGVEREVDRGLGHHAASDGRRVRGASGLGGAEVREEGIERGNLGSAGSLTEHHAVVITGDGKNGAIVVAERFVELVIVVLTLTEVVDDVAQVEEEGGAGVTAGFDIIGHGVGDGGFFGDGDCGGLLGAGLGGAGVSDGVEGDFSGLRDGADEVLREEIFQVEERRDIRPRQWDGLDLVLVDFVVRRLVVGRAGVVDLKGAFVGTRLRVGVSVALRAGNAREIDSGVRKAHGLILLRERGRSQILSPARLRVRLLELRFRVAG